MEACFEPANKLQNCTFFTSSKLLDHPETLGFQQVAYTFIASVCCYLDSVFLGQ